MVELWEYQSRNIYDEEMIDNKTTSGNGNVSIAALGRKEDKEAYAQGAMVSQ